MPQLASSHVQSAEYDDESAQLTVTFQSGEVYIYSEVPKFVYENLITMPDPGGYFRNNIKGLFSYERVG